MAVHHPGLQQEIGDLMYQIRQLVAQAMQNASFGSAGLRVYGGGWIRIENGGLDVTGTAIVTGRLEGSGTLDWLGPWNLRGPGNIEGDTDVTGNTDFIGRVRTTGDAEFGGDTTIKGSLDVQAATRLRGDTTLENDLEILAGGKIKAGGMIIDTANNGSVTFANGATVHAGSDSVSILYNNRSVTVDGAGIRLGALSVDGGGVNINLGSIGTVTGTGLPAGVLMVDTATGYIKRVYN